MYWPLLNLCLWIQWCWISRKQKEKQQPTNLNFLCHSSTVLLLPVLIKTVGVSLVLGIHSSQIRLRFPKILLGKCCPGLWTFLPESRSIECGLTAFTKVIKNIQPPVHLMKASAWPTRWSTKPHLCYFVLNIYDYSQFSFPLLFDTRSEVSKVGLQFCSRG